MKDAINQEIRVGDLVATTRNNSQVTAAVVIDITPRKVRLLHPQVQDRYHYAGTYRFDNSFVKFPGEVIVIPGGVSVWEENRPQQT